ncbi:hydroxyisourate hydrolase [Curtobacterium sp. 'Ferrero']|uniref:hydroxyisourate hydrolase n=1 Tax=Curtobacterium sp. 'Ferrero' TaxID=2033654 RepID=UPI000BD4A8A9|nr:hydroxyisourate hydrolase [Curtobacterium sp. 'Ferrero']PCN47809.1 hydroxyisourate hydrolase [Curtobacterium sp. 'Ferrero']
MSHLTTHVLDTTNGRPAAGVAVLLTGPDGTVVATATTDVDGRVGTLGPDVLAPGDWTLTFATGDYWRAAGVTAFHPRVAVVVTVPTDPAPHYHVPLLVNPFAYSTYRGS